MLQLVKKLLSFKTKRKIKEQLGVPSFHWSLENLKRKDFIPEVVLDVGAFEGQWTKEFLEVFPSSKILMVEAQQKKEATLKGVKQGYPNVDYVISLISSEDGMEIAFEEAETGSHVVTYQSQKDQFLKLTSRSLDSLLESRGFPLPDFLKLDVQGHELEVLKGASKALNNATICLLELSFLNLGDNTPLLAEMVAFMDKNNFQAYDISQFYRRPFDNALYQADVFFVKKDSYLVTNRSW